MWDFASNGMFMIAIISFFLTVMVLIACGCTPVQSVLDTLLSPIVATSNGVTSIFDGIESILVQIGTGIFSILDAIGQGILNLLSGQLVVDVLCVFFKPDCACGC